MMPASEKKPESGQTFDTELLARALRGVGALLVVASASTFMLQRWQAGNDLWRYAMLGGHSLLLLLVAHLSGHKLRESRSARSLLALFLATVPVVFAVLGGLLYSQFQLEALPPLPHHAIWTAPSRASALLAFAVSLLVLAPLSLIAFVALARKEAKLLCATFLGGNLLMLLPLREPAWALLLAAVSLFASLWLELSRFAVATRLDTLEGRLARAMPFVAPLIMVGRVFHLYEFSSSTVGGCLLIAAVFCWSLAPRLEPRWREGCAWLCAGSALGGWACCWVSVAAGAHASAWLLGLGVPSALLLIAAAFRAERTRELLGWLATLCAISTTALASLLDPCTLAALASVVVGLAVASWGVVERAWPRALLGAALGLFGLGLALWLAVWDEGALRWASLSGLGLALIVGAAQLERRRARKPVTASVAESAG
ncbi:MAG: hypothetical protein QM756_02745 [Polyangiaceae bacterium]